MHLNPHDTHSTSLAEHLAIFLHKTDHQRQCSIVLLASSTSDVRRPSAALSFFIWCWTARNGTHFNIFIQHLLAMLSHFLPFSTPRTSMKVNEGCREFRNTTATAREYWALSKTCSNRYLELLDTFVKCSIVEHERTSAHFSTLGMTAG